MARNGREGPQDPPVEDDWTWLLNQDQAPAPHDEPGAAADADAAADEAYEVRDEILLEKQVASVTFRLRGFKDGAAFEAPSWLIEGVLPARGVTMLYAPPSAGKTWVADDWAVRIASGTPWLGRPVTSGSVLYIAAEGAFTLPLRTAAAKGNLGLHRQLPIFTVSEPVLFGAAGTHVEILADIVKEKFRSWGWPSVALVVVDTYTVSIEGSANDDDVASAFMRGFRRFLRHLAPGGSPVPAGLIIHHPGLKDSERPRGSSAFTGDVDCGFLLEELQEVGGEPQGSQGSPPEAPETPPADPAAPPRPPEARTLVLHCAKPPRQGLPPPDIAFVLQPIILTDDEARPIEVGTEILTALVVQPSPGTPMQKSRRDERSERRRAHETRALSCLVGSEPLQSEAWRQKSEVSSTATWERVRDNLIATGKVVQVEPLAGKTRYRYALSSADHLVNPVD